MIDRLFLEHPRSVGETYREHAVVATRFGVRMILGGVACLVHALMPVLFQRTGSSTVKALYAHMKARQPRFAEQPPSFTDPEWQLNYEI